MEDHEQVKLFNASVSKGLEILFVLLVIVLVAAIISQTILDYSVHLIIAATAVSMTAGIAFASID